MENTLTPEEIKEQLENLPEELKQALAEFDDLEVVDTDDYIETGAISVNVESEDNEDDTKIGNQVSELLQRFARMDFSEDLANNAHIAVANLFKKKWKEYDFKGLVFPHQNTYEFEVLYEPKQK